MDIRFTYNCTFIFPGWETTEETKDLFFMGLAATFLFGFYSQFIFNLKHRYYDNEGKGALDLFLQLLLLINVVLSMYLLMTCNAAVIIVLLISQIIGYFLTLRIGVGKLSYNSSYDSYLLRDE